LNKVQLYQENQTAKSIWNEKSAAKFGTKIRPQIYFAFAFRSKFILLSLFVPNLFCFRFSFQIYFAFAFRSKFILQQGFSFQIYFATAKIDNDPFFGNAPNS